MKIFPDDLEIIDPCGICNAESCDERGEDKDDEEYSPTCPQTIWYCAQRSMLWNKAEDVDLNELFETFCECEVRTIRLHDGVEYYSDKRFAEYVQKVVKERLSAGNEIRLHVNNDKPW